VLASAGARPDLGRVATHCAAGSELVCELLRAASSPLLQPGASADAEPPSADPRIRAASVAAPGMAFTLDTQGLADVRVPVQLWSADEDANVPYATNTRLVREGLGDRVEFHPVPGAVHFSFLVPCGPVGPPLLCADPPPFDREAFHAEMNARVVAFFDRTLAR
jgi:predicted dienelactone hydrolase